MKQPEEFAPETVSELCRHLRENATGSRQRVQPVGGRTALRGGWAGTGVDQLIDVRSLNKVIDYPARDLTVTVEAGMRCKDLQRLLATERQQVPIDLAQAARATIGGAVATNTNGPRRFGYGTFRDAVIGISAVDAHGRLFKAGGRVVKNVAGYDLCKLLVGSRGALAIITQLTFKLRPMSETIGWWWITFDQLLEAENVLERLLTSSARPVAVELLSAQAARQVAAESRVGLPVDAPVLALAVEGTAAEVDWQLNALHQEVVPFGVQRLEQVLAEDGYRLLAALTEFPVNADVPVTIQANLRPSQAVLFAEELQQRGIAVLAHAGTGVVIGQFPEEIVSLTAAAEKLQELISLAASRHGNVVVLHCDQEWQNQLPMWGRPEPAWPAMLQLKQHLDPQGLLCPGQFVDGVSAEISANGTAGAFSR
jgi:glycolate oxidase FAD binding subunit